jgi:FkbM family methyltransferase
MIKIQIDEFIPPIFKRIFKRIKKYSGSHEILEPFKNIPELQKVEWIMDVGANVGDVAVAGLNSCPNSKLIAFEPVGDTFLKLKNRLDDFSDRVFLFNCALSDKNDEGEINITTEHGANSIESQAFFHKKFNPHVQEIKREKISLRKLDDLIEDLPSRKIDVLKIDVEGHELKVINGGVNFISNYVDVIIIEISLMRDDSWENQALFNIFEKLNAMGFRLINIYDLHRSSSQSDSQLVQMDCVFRHKRYLIN